MDTYDALDNIYTSDDDPRAEDLKNAAVLSLEAVPTMPQGNNIWDNVETYRVDLYHAQKSSIHRLRELLQKYPATQAFYGSDPTLVTTQYDMEDVLASPWLTGTGSDDPVRSDTVKHGGSYSLRLNKNTALTVQSFAWQKWVTPAAATRDNRLREVSAYYYPGATSGAMDWNGTFFMVDVTAESVERVTSSFEFVGGHIWANRYLMTPPASMVDLGVYTPSTWIKLTMRDNGDHTGTYLINDEVVLEDKSHCYNDWYPDVELYSNSFCFEQWNCAEYCYVDDATVIAPTTISLNFLEKSIRPRQPVYMKRMKNGMHHWAMTFDVHKTVEVS